MEEEIEAKDPVYRMNFFYQDRKSSQGPLNRFPLASNYQN